jgi:hypothetical protein
MKTISDIVTGGGGGSRGEKRSQKDSQVAGFGRRLSLLLYTGMRQEHRREGREESRFTCVNLSRDSVETVLELRRLMWLEIRQGILMGSPSMRA